MEYYEASQNNEVGLCAWTWKDVPTYVFRHYEKNVPIFINILQKHIHVHPHVYELKKETKPQSSVNKTTILGNRCLEDKKE